MRCVPNRVLSQVAQDMERTDGGIDRTYGMAKQIPLANPFVLPKKTHLRWRPCHALASTFTNRDDVPHAELLTCFGSVDRRC